MLVQLYSQEQIVNHIENNSPTKFMYTFNKARRFPKIDKNGKTDSIYNIPSSQDRRETAFGYGKKSDFTKDFYRGTEFISIKRDFDKGNEPGVKYTFGLPRNKFEKQVVPGYKNFDKCNNHLEIKVPNIGLMSPRYFNKKYIMKKPMII